MTVTLNGRRMRAEHVQKALPSGETILNIKIRRLVALPLLIPFCAAAQSAPKPMDLDHSVLNAFQVMCNLELPDFSRIDAKATAMRMHVQSEASAPSANGTVTRRKAWVGGLTTGPFALLLDEMDGPKGTVTSCAVAAQVPDANAFRIATIDDLRLPSTNQQLDPTGAKESEWRDVSGPGTTLILRAIVKGETSSVMVKLVSMHPRQ
jgi:hypothetical protein